jgi:aminoglycoside phosphotransferase family enzyme/predicted kinase
MASIVQDLVTSGLTLEETHISWVLLGEDEVWKVKRPVDFGFLDFSTLDKRRQACQAEVELNRRLAPDVYLGVVPVTRHGDGEVVDWAVHMRRLPQARRADHLLAAGRLGTTEVQRVAQRLAAFHSQAREDEETRRYGGVESIAYNVRENFEQTRPTIGDYLPAQRAAEIESWQRAFLEDNTSLFAARLDAGRVRDGHGDLRLEHVYLGEDGAVTIIDCIEFNQRFRFADVAADLAFLAMDLAWHGRVDLAEGLLAAYARASGDYDLYPLIDFYESYRAFVRAKVSSFMATDDELPAPVRERATAEARRYYLLSLASERRSLLPPRLVAVGGAIASGKSTVAQALAAELSAPVVEADRTRKQLLGVEPTQPVHVPAFQGPYTPEASRRVYAELRRRAGAVLASGRPVVIDASFRSAAERRAVRQLAADHGVPFLFVECRAPRTVLVERLERRAAETGVSDGRLEILDDFLDRFEAVEELAAREHLKLGTEKPLEENLKRLDRRLATWPPGLTD